MRTPASERWSAALGRLLKTQPTGPARGDRPGNSPVRNEPGPWPAHPAPQAEAEGELVQAADMHAPGHADTAPSVTVNTGGEYDAARQT